MKISITLFFLFLFFTSFSQTNLVFDDVELKENMRLVGMHTYYDKEKTFENYNFIIEDLKALDSVTEIIQKGKEIVNQSTNNEFDIRLLDGDVILKTWSFNPKYSYIRIHGKSYEFDASQIMRLAVKFGFKYDYYKKDYQSKEEFDNDYDYLKSNPDLLFVYKPDFRFKGTFKVRCFKSSKFKNPKVILEYLNDKISKIRNEDEFRSYYSLKDFDRNNPNQYIMTIESEFELFEIFDDKKAEKQSWSENKYFATIFLKH